MTICKTIALTRWTFVDKVMSLLFNNITVTALDENDQEVQTRVFADVPLRNGYKTNYRGTFFIDTPMTMSFTIGDWNEYDTVNF